MPGEVAQQPTILIVEDEPDIRRFLRISLVNHGYTLLETPKGEEGLALLAEKKPALVILDLGLPDLDGVNFTKRAREWSSVPIIVLSARTQEKDKSRRLRQARMITSLSRLEFSSFSPE